MFRKKRWISTEWYRKKLRKLLTRCGLLLKLCFQGDDADESSFSRAFSQKLDMAVLESEEGKIFPGTVMERVKGEKLIIFRRKRRKTQRRKVGHRQQHSLVKIEKITA